MSENTPKKPDQSSSSRRARGARLQHVVVHQPQDIRPGFDDGLFDDIVVFGQELDALRHIVGKPDWRYVAVAHGASVAEALKAAGS